MFGLLHLFFYLGEPVCRCYIECLLLKYSEIALSYSQTYKLEKSNVAKAQVAGTAGSRTWTEHGKLPWVDYTAAKKNDTETVIPVSEDQKKEDDNMVTYKYLADVPEYYKAAVDKAIHKGGLWGTGNGELNISEDLCRTLTVLDRLGRLD